ncbi:MAG: NADH-quinone oxidoreductase subunit G [Gammaproteobacteria bacterium]|nr:NADH-quinone oxidoreductase subunit G [Gammaproteobacteria bacterium]
MSNLINIEIDGITMAVVPGSRLIDVADEQGVTIPRFCYHSKLSLAASCRMCLVEIERAPKPMPACSTTVTEGMKVYTRSPKVIASQRSVMEFLLINHPLDCPVCDQGGECELQEIAVGYGRDGSAYGEVKRQVVNPDLGALIATDMNRCIHCTRCVRFGDEIAGMMELGAPGRGEHMHISTFIQGSVESELSGNVIDLCPVGALTSKPYRYRARPWELQSATTISLHDSLGTRIVVDSRRGEMMRVVATEMNDPESECWISDRDRFSSLALSSEDRLVQPMIKVDGQWQSVDWDRALTFAAEGLQKVINNYGSDALAALAGLTQVNEEYYLLQKLLRSLGSNNLDHRLYQVDCNDDATAPLYNGFGQSPRDLERSDLFLVIGADLRREIPLLAQRLRSAARHGATVMSLNCGGTPERRVTHPAAALEINLSPQALVDELLAIAAALHPSTTAKTLTKQLAAVTVNERQQQIATALKNANHATLLLGAGAQSHSQLSLIRQLCHVIAAATGAVVSFATIGGNAAGAALAGVLPHRKAGGERLERSGLDWQQMLAAPLKGVVLLGLEPELDSVDAASLMRLLKASEFNLLLTPFASPAMYDYGDVLLPIATWFESAGSTMNGYGEWHQISPALPLYGAARPAWKILRVLGNLLNLSGFSQMSIEDCRRELQAASAVTPAAVRSGCDGEMSAAYDAPSAVLPAAGELQRIAALPLYQSDMLVRRSAVLQQGAIAAEAQQVAIAPSDAEALNLVVGRAVELSQGSVTAQLPWQLSRNLAAGTIYLPTGVAALAQFDHGNIAVRGV